VNDDSEYYYQHICYESMIECPDHEHVTALYRKRCNEECAEFTKSFNESPTFWAKTALKDGVLEFPDKETKKGMIAANEVNLFYAFDRAFVNKVKATAALVARGPYLVHAIDAALVEMLFAMDVYRPSLLACRRAFTAWTTSRMRTDNLMNAVKLMKARYLREASALHDAAKVIEKAMKLPQ